MYPAYPAPRINIAASEPKMSLGEAASVYDELTALGLFLIPRKSGTKIPLPAYWNKTLKESQDYSREALLKTQKRSDVNGWCVKTGESSDRVVVIDIDPAEVTKFDNDPQEIYNQIQAMSSTGFVLHSPANGVHLYFKVPETYEMLTNQSPPVRGIDLRGSGGQVLALGSWVRYEGEDIQLKKGVPSSQTARYEKLPDGNYSEIPEMSQELYDWLISTVSHRTPAQRQLDEAREYQASDQASRRVKAHFNQPLERREAVVLDCLNYVLPTLHEKTTYETWLSVWMSAHNGAPTIKVRDYLLTHPSVYWRDGDWGKEEFKAKWSDHTHREGGHTVATLFYLARRAGWLTTTGYEIPDELFTHIDVERITDWTESLTELPRRVALMSQTGSGKTQNLIHLFKRLDSPKTVVFVPSIKLATELASTLRSAGLPATLYLNITTGRSISAEAMREAKLLVTTLQTFATKVCRDVQDAAQWELVYIEESDQLLAQFARGGGGVQSSQVRDYEARAGYNILKEVYARCKYVWAVDATMSQITKVVAETFSKEPVMLVKNLKVKPKANVFILKDRGQALQAVLRALTRGQRVVAACDTATQAEEVVAIMEGIGALDGKRSICITRNTERHPSVQSFMQNVNAEAAKYDLIAYNSVMASGVSITDVTPDLIVQFSGYLSPRANLQILNRFRSQKKVYVAYRPGENLYSDTALTVLQEAANRLDIESRLIYLPAATRTDVAKLRAEMAAVSIGDENLQNRAAREFYIGLLEADGRRVEWGEEIEVDERLMDEKSAVSELRAEDKERVRQGWAGIPPIDVERPPEDGLTDIEIRMGEAHAYIERTLLGNIPEDKEPAYIYDVVQELGKFSYPLTMFANQELALNRTESFLSDEGRAITTISASLALVKVVALLHILYHRIDEGLTNEAVAHRAPGFLQSLAQVKDQYDAAVTRKNQKFEVVWNRTDVEVDRALAFSKIILALVGLKQRSERVSRVGGEPEYVTRITNLQEASDFLSWRMHGTDMRAELELTASVVNAGIISRQQAAETFAEMSDDKQAEVLRLWREERHTDFENAVIAVHSGQSAL